MEFLLDVHVHSITSGHAYSTITENAYYGSQIGLSHIGVSEHGPAMGGGAHEYFFGNIHILPDYIHGVRVLKGAEVNIKDINGSIDLDENILKRLDYVIASIHRGVLIPTHRDDHTAALVNVMENPNVHIIGHPVNVWFDVDIEAIVHAAARTHTILELNESSLTPGSFRYQGDEEHLIMLRLCKQLNVPILASSDAHYHTLVGRFERCKELIHKVGFSENQILNTNENYFFDAIKRKQSYQSGVSV